MNGRLVDGRLVDGQLVDGRLVDGRSVDGRLVDGQLVDGRLRRDYGKVFQDGMSSGWLMGGGESTEKLSIAECLSPRSINSNKVLVELANFNHYSCSIPFVGVSSCLILDPHPITNLQRR